MKLSCLLLVLCTPSLALANEASAGKILKSSDGKAAYCVEERDLNNNAYIPNYFGVTGGDNIKVELSISSLICDNSDGKLSWKPFKFYGPVHRTDIYGNPIIHHLRELEFVLIDENLSIQGIIPIENKTEQNLSFSLNLSKAGLTKKLKEGEELFLKYELFLRGLLSIEIVNSSEIRNMGQFSGGSYFISFKIKKIGEELIISSPMIN